MKKRIKELLQRAGLRDEEVKLYLLLLKLRHASMPELIAESGLNVMTAYRTMKRLQEHGIVESLKLNNKQCIYAPLTLQRLIGQIDVEQRKLRKLQLALKGLDSYLPYMDLDSDDRNDEELIEVKEGAEAFREEYLKLPGCCEDEYFHIGAIQNHWAIAGITDESSDELSFRANRYRRGIFARCLNTDSPEIRAIAKRDSKEMRTLRIVNDLPFTRDYQAIVPTHVAHFICDPDHPRVILMRHPDLVKLHLQHVKRMWEDGTHGEA